MYDLHVPDPIDIPVKNTKSRIAILIVLVFSSVMSEMYEYSPRNMHMKPPNQNWMTSSIKYSTTKVSKKITLIKNQTL